jgi:hypothetical protein
MARWMDEPWQGMHPWERRRRVATSQHLPDPANDSLYIPSQKCGCANA